MKTFAYDHTLLPLPVPQLQATCSAIPELVAPLVDAETLAATIAAVEEFSRPGGAGEILQKKLTDRRSALPGNASWLRPFWDDMYLSYREPLPVNMNYFFRLSSRRWGRSLALPRFVRGLCSVFRQFSEGELVPEPARNGFQAMDQMSSCLFTRIPGAARDVLGPVNLMGLPTIAVVCRGHWFILPLQDEEGEMASEGALEALFAGMRAEAAALPEAVPLGAMTTAARPEAACLRAALQDTAQNRINLADLERALFVVCLDGSHASPEDMGLRLLGGDAANRWFDKSLQVIATENGEIGVNFEHAGCDAGIWLYLLTMVDEVIMKNGLPSGSREQRPRRLIWNVQADAAEKLSLLRNSFAEKMQGLELCCHEYPQFSRAEIKALGCSPDAFLQVAFQVAQYEIFGKLRSTYEAVSMRGFAEGRTECARPSSADALAFAKALALREARESERNNAGDRTPEGKAPGIEELRELFRKAERTHLARLVRCQRGMGIERHMYGLQAMYALHGESLGLAEPPAVFADAGWKTLKHDSLSTSGIGAPFIRFFGFGPVVADGLGLGYGIEREAVSLVVAAFRGGPCRAGDFAGAFEKAAGAIAALLRNGDDPRNAGQEGLLPPLIPVAL